MGILDQILAQVDNARKVAGKNTKDFVANPKDFLNMVTGRVSEQNKKLASGDKDLLNEILGNAIPGGALATRWQGSPNFIRGTKFDMSKLGTGEGAQVIARGHYVAENPEVATSYRENLSARKLAEKLQEGYDYEDPISAQMLRSTEFTSPERKFLAALQKEDLLGFDYPTQAIRTAGSPKARVDYDISPELQQATAKLGHLYKVDIPDEAIAKMIDFNKTLKDQPHLAKLISKADSKLAPEDTGRDLYKAIEASMGKKGAQEFFNSEGIPGVTYLDQGSRKSGGTTNNVLFNDELARIIEKNGKPTGEKPWMPGEYGYKSPTEAEKDTAVANILKFISESGVKL